MEQKSKINEKMVTGLLPIIGDKLTKRQVENALHTNGKIITLITLAVGVLLNSLIWAVVVAVIFTIMGHFINNAFLEAMYGDGKYSDENGDVDPMMQLFKTLKKLNEEGNNLTKQTRK